MCECKKRGTVAQSLNHRPETYSAQVHECVEDHGVGNGVFLKRGKVVEDELANFAFHLVLEEKIHKGHEAIHAEDFAVGQDKFKQRAAKKDQGKT